VELYGLANEKHNSSVINSLFTYKFYAAVLYYADQWILFFLSGVF